MVFSTIPPILHHSPCESKRDQSSPDEDPESSEERSFSNRQKAKRCSSSLKKEESRLVGSDARIPLSALGGVELILRSVNYGPDLSLFATEVIGGRAYYIMNPDVKARYFTQVEFSPTTSADYFPVEKQEGTFRIFCLGGSTTVGFPYGYAGSFPLHLRERLRRMFPDRNIEVINLGMTATNSFTALDLATELPAYDPDLIVVYDGHNEFYGALGVASRESVGQSRLAHPPVPPCHSQQTVPRASRCLCTNSGAYRRRGPAETVPGQ